MFSRTLFKFARFHVNKAFPPKQKSGAKLGVVNYFSMNSSSSAIETPKRILYIKGYKLDMEKIRVVFKREDDKPEPTYHFKWLVPIINCIPEEAYKYVGNGVEPDGELNLVLVLEEGYDEVALKASDVQPPDALPKESLEVLTPGVWPNEEQDE